MNYSWNVQPGYVDQNNADEYDEFAEASQRGLDPSEDMIYEYQGKHDHCIGK